MPSMEQALCSYLMGRTAVTDIIGTGSSGRLYANVLPQSCAIADGPAATYQIIDSTEENLLAPDRSGFVQSRLQITCFADTHDGAISLARAIKNSGLATLKGVSGGVDFRGVLVDGIQCYAETPTDGSSEYRYIADFYSTISYHEG